MIKYELNWTDPLNAHAYLTPIPAFQCPTRGSLEKVYAGDAASFSTGALVESKLAAHYYAIMGGAIGCTSTQGYTVLGSCTSASGQQTGVYATNGIMYPRSKIRHKDIVDGTSKTFLVGEVSWEIYANRAWICGGSAGGGITWGWAARNIANPINSVTAGVGSGGNWDQVTVLLNSSSLGSQHGGGAFIGNADGSVHFASENTEMNLLRAAASRSNGESI